MKKLSFLIALLFLNLSFSGCLAREGSATEGSATESWERGEQKSGWSLRYLLPWNWCPRREKPVPPLPAADARRVRVDGLQMEKNPVFSHRNPEDRESGWGEGVGDTGGVGSLPTSGRKQSSFSIGTFILSGEKRADGSFLVLDTATAAFLEELNPRLTLFAQRINDQEFTRRVRREVTVPMFLWSVAAGYGKLVVSTGNLEFSLEPLIGIDPVLEHNSRSSPYYSSKTNLFFLLYLPYINFVFLPPFAAESFHFHSYVLKKFQSINTPIPFNEGHKWIKRAFIGGVLAIGSVNFILEASNYIQLQKTYGTLARNAAAIPYFYLSLVWLYFQRSLPTIDKVFLRFFSGKTTDVRAQRKSLYDLANRAEWAAHKHLAPQVIAALHSLIVGTRNVHTSEGITRLKREMLDEIDLQSPGRIEMVRKRLDNHLPSYLSKAIDLEQFLSGILRGLSPSRLEDVKKILSEKELFKNPQTLTKDQRDTYKLITLLMLSDQIPETEAVPYPAMRRDKVIRSALLWIGRGLGVASLVGFTAAWHYTLEEAGVPGVGNWFLAALLSTMRVTNGNMFGQNLVNIYDRWTGFRYPNQERTEPHHDQFVNQDGQFRSIFSLINGALFPMVILNQALRGSGFKWHVDIETTTVTLDPNNVPFTQAFLPLIPMLLSMAGPGGYELSANYGSIINMVQRLPCCRKSRKDGLHRASIVGWLEQVKRAIIYAPDEVIAHLSALREELSGRATP